MTESAPQSNQDKRIAAILPAAGRGQRFGRAENKLFAMLCEEPLWFHTARVLASRPEIGRILMAISDQDRPVFEGPYAKLVNILRIELVRGGSERTDSVRAGLDALDGDNSIAMVAIHDAARPLVSDADLTAVFSRASKTGAAILATPVPGTIKRKINSDDHSITIDRRELWVAQTPQVFHVDLLRQAYDRYRGRPATDDAELVERIGHPVALVRGRADNIKITYPEDLWVAEAILNRESKGG
ncbi:2-C-methyl-D-erythritol 4-phosphate cytidylyltransferase [Planctomycetes bacterium CA13]